MTGRQLLKFVTIICLAMTSAPSLAADEPTFSRPIGPIFDTNRFSRISQLGMVPGIEQSRLLLQDVDVIHAQTLKAPSYNGDKDLIRLARGLYGALLNYQNKIQPFKSVDSYRPSHLAAMYRASVDARVELLVVLKEGLRRPIADWPAYYDSALALIEVQKIFFGGATPNQVAHLKKALSEWPRVFEAVLLTATPAIQTILVNQVLDKKFSPPENMFGIEARKIVADSIRLGQLHPDVIDQLRDRSVYKVVVANAATVSHIPFNEFIKGEAMIPVLTKADLTLWERESLKSIPGGVAEYMAKDFESLNEFIEAFNRLTMSKKQMVSETPSESLTRQLNLYHLDMHYGLDKPYVHVAILIKGILSGVPNANFLPFESWSSIIDSLKSTYGQKLVHPLFGEFALKMLADFLRVGREHFPMSPVESLGLIDLFIRGSHYKQDHPQIRRIAETAIESNDFAAETKLAAFNYLIEQSKQGEQTKTVATLVSRKMSLLSSFPKITSKRGDFPGAPVEWHQERAAQSSLLMQPQLEIWLWQNGLRTDDLSGCEASLL